MNQSVYVELIKSRRLTGQKWRFRVRGNNNEIVATSEHYTYLRDALATVRLLFPEGVRTKRV